MQTYSAYDSYLDGINAEKYLSSTAPDNILFSYQCIDNRYCMFDETETKLAMLKRYSPVIEYADLLLLKKNSTDNDLQKNNIWSFTSKLGDVILIPEETTKIVTTKIKTSYSLLGKLRSILYQPPELLIELTLKDGTKFKHRAPHNILAGGVIINKYVGNISESNLFFGKQFDKLRDIKEIKVYSLKPWGFKESVEVSFEVVA